jgi:hypothetical protein
VFTVQQVEKHLAHNALVAHIDAVPKGHIRIETGFLYPDGASIDVFLEQEDGLPVIQKPRLTDFGGTWSWLQNLEIKPNKSATQKLYFNRIMELYHCALRGAAIELEVDTLDDLPSGIARLGQACLRTADLIYSKRLRVQNSFNQDVEDVIADIVTEYESGSDIPLRTGSVVKVDFRTRGKKLETAIQTLSSGNGQYAHQRAVEINARWDDLRELSDWTNIGNQCVTVFDDSVDVYDSQDLDRLERKSVVLPASNVETLSSILKAA